jgi:hypothetical protein
LPTWTWFCACSASVNTRAVIDRAWVRVAIWSSSCDRGRGGPHDRPSAARPARPAGRDGVRPQCAHRLEELGRALDAEYAHPLADPQSASMSWRRAAAMTALTSREGVPAGRPIEVADYVPDHIGCSGDSISFAARTGVAVSTRRNVEAMGATRGFEGQASRLLRIGRSMRRSDRRARVLVLPAFWEASLEIWARSIHDPSRDRG